LSTEGDWRKEEDDGIGRGLFVEEFMVVSWLPGLPAVRHRHSSLMFVI